MTRPPPTDDHDLQRRNRRMAAYVFAVVILMVGVSFAAVPLYALFCKVTGFGGTTMVAQDFPDRVTDRMVTIRFNADTASDLPWEFKPEQREIKITAGQKGLTAFKAKNYTGAPVTGTAVYNVTPLKAGKYFQKVACFCFGEQTLGPGEAMDMPVMFFIDPAFAEDVNMQDVKTITLSYTFFKAETRALEQALEDFYNQPVIPTDVKR